MVSEIAKANASTKLQVRERRGHDLGGQLELFDQSIHRPTAATTDGVQQTCGGAVRRRPTLGRGVVAAGRKRLAFGVAEAKLAFGVAAELELAVMQEVMVGRAKDQTVAPGAQSTFAASD